MTFEEVRDDPEHRAGWLRYAIEFYRRGLRPTDIDVHGPHPGANYIWGNADARDDIRYAREIQFAAQDGSGGRPIGIRMWEMDGRTRRSFPIVPLSEETKERLKAAVDELDKICRSRATGSWLETYRSELPVLKRRLHL